MSETKLQQVEESRALVKRLEQGLAEAIEREQDSRHRHMQETALYQMHLSVLLQLVGQAKTMVVTGQPLVLPGQESVVPLYFAWHSRVLPSLLLIQVELERVSRSEPGLDRVAALERAERNLKNLSIHAVGAGPAGMHLEGLVQSLLTQAAAKAGESARSAGRLKELLEKGTNAREEIAELEPQLVDARAVLETLEYEYLLPAPGPRTEVRSDPDGQARLGGEWLESIPEAGSVLQRQLHSSEESLSGIEKGLVTAEIELSALLRRVKGAEGEALDRVHLSLRDDLERKINRQLKTLEGMNPQLAYCRAALNEMRKALSERSRCIADLEVEQQRSDFSKRDLENHRRRISLKEGAFHASRERFLELLPRPDVSAEAVALVSEIDGRIEEARQQYEQILEFEREQEALRREEEARREKERRRVVLDEASSAPARPPPAATRTPFPRPEEIEQRSRNRPLPAPPAPPSAARPGTAAPAPLVDPLAGLGASAFLARRERRHDLAAELEKRRRYDQAESRLLRQLERVGEAADRARPLVSTHAAGMQAAIARLDAQIAGLKGLKGPALSEGARQVGYTLGEMAAMARRLGLSSAPSVRALQKAINERRDALARLAAGLPPDGRATEADHQRLEALRGKVPGLEKVIAPRPAPKPKAGMLGGGGPGALAGLSVRGGSGALPPIDEREQRLGALQETFQRKGKLGLIEAAAPGSGRPVKQLDDSLALVAKLTGQGHKPLARKWGSLSSFGSGLAQVAKKAVKVTPLGVAAAGAMSAGSALGKAVSSGAAENALTSVGGALAKVAAKTPAGLAIQAATKGAKAVGGLAKAAAITATKGARKTALALGRGMQSAGSLLGEAMAGARDRTKEGLQAALSGARGAAQSTGRFFKGLITKTTGVVGAIKGKVKTGLSSFRSLASKALPIAKTVAMAAIPGAGLAALAYRNRHKIGGLAKAAWNKTKEIGSAAGAFLQSPAGQLLTTGLSVAATFIPGGLAVKAGIGAIAGAVSAVAKGGGLKEALMGAVSGGIQGAVPFLKIGAAKKLGLGAVKGALDAAVNGGDFKDVAKGAFFGSVTMGGGAALKQWGGGKGLQALGKYTQNKKGALQKIDQFARTHGQKITKGAVWTYDKTGKATKVLGAVKTGGEHAHSALEMISKGAAWGANRAGEGRFGEVLRGLSERSGSGAERLDKALTYVKTAEKYTKRVHNVLGVAINLGHGDPNEAVKQMKARQAEQRKSGVQGDRFDRIDNFFASKGEKVVGWHQSTLSKISGGIGTNAWGKTAFEKLAGSRDKLVQFHGKWDTINEAVGKGVGAAEKVQDGLKYIALMTEGVENPRLKWLGETAYSMQKGLDTGLVAAKGLHGLSSLGQGALGGGLRAGGVDKKTLDEESKRRKVWLGLEDSGDKTLVAGALDSEVGENEMAAHHRVKQYDDFKKKLMGSEEDPTKIRTALENWRLQMEMLGESEKYGRDDEERKTGSSRTLAAGWLLGNEGPEGRREGDHQKKAWEEYEKRRQERESAEKAPAPVAGTVETLPEKPANAPAPDAAKKEIDRELEKAAAQQLQQEASREAQQAERDEKTAADAVQKETGLDPKETDAVFASEEKNEAPPPAIPSSVLAGVADEEGVVGEEPPLAPLPGLEALADESGIAGGPVGPQPPLAELVVDESRLQTLDQRLKALRERVDSDFAESDRLVEEGNEQAAGTVLTALTIAAQALAAELSRLRASGGDESVSDRLDRFQQRYEEIRERLGDLVTPPAPGDKAPVFDEVPTDAMSKALHGWLRAYVARARTILGAARFDPDQLSDLRLPADQIVRLSALAAKSGNSRAAAFAAEVRAALHEWQKRIAEKLKAKDEQAEPSLEEGVETGAVDGEEEPPSSEAKEEPDLGEEPALVALTDGVTEGKDVASAEDGLLFGEPVEDTYIGSGSAARPIADGLASGFKFGNLEPQGPTLANALAGLGGAIMGLGGSVKGAAGDVKEIGEEVSLSGQAISGIGGDVGALVGVEDNALTKLGGGLDTFAGWVKEGSDKVGGGAGKVEDGGDKLHGFGDAWREKGFGKAVGQLFRKGRGAGSDPAQAPVVDASAYSDAPQRLDYSVMGQMERFLGSSFTDVKIHTGKGAELVTQRFDAEAVTIREHIFFAPGRFQPQTTEGRKLLAHELTHVKQRGRPNLDTRTAEEEAHRAEALYGAPGMEILDLSMPEADFRLDDGGASANPTGVFTAKRTRSLSSGSSSVDEPVEGEELLDLVGERVYELLEEELERELENR